jgi:uncharacterized repeat protein (TIGR01451 family)
MFPLFSKAQDLEWVKGMGGPNSSNASSLANSIKIGSDGSIYTYGSFFDGTIDFDPGIGTYNLSSISTTSSYISKHDSSGNFIWARQLIGVTQTNVSTTSMAIDSQDNIVVTGFFGGTFDADPGPGVFNLINSSLNYVDAFVIKLNPSGDLVWARQVRGDSSVVMNCIATDAVGNIIVGGATVGDTAIIEPGSDTLVLTPSPWHGFILKLDPAGNYIWSEDLAGAAETVVEAIGTDGNGNIIISGYFGTTVDFDPGPGVLNLNSQISPGFNSNKDVFVQKLDPSGNLIWVKQISGNSSEMSNHVALDNAGNIYITGIFYFDLDFPGSAIQPIIGSGDSDGYILKMDALGNFLWAKKIGNAFYNWIYGMAIDDGGDVYVSCRFEGTMDVDPGPGIVELSAVSNAQHAIIRLNSLGGEFVWGKKLASNSSGTQVASLEVNESGSIFANGTYRLNCDFDLGSGVYSISTPYVPQDDIFIVKWLQDSCVSLSFTFDSVASASCLAPGYISAHPLSGTAPFGYSWNTVPVTNDSIISPVLGGVYTLTMNDASGCTRSTQVLLNGPTDPSTGNFDLMTNLVSGDFRTGVASTIDVNAFNGGCMPVNGQLTLTLDNGVDYDGAVPPPQNISGNVLAWNFSNLVYGSPHLTPRVFLHTSLSAQIGDTLCFSTSITPLGGDIDSTNNTRNYCYPVINGYDPNDKQVYPAGACIPHYINKDQALTYTIRFQNTGNASAINVNVFDSLDTGLNLNSLRIVGSSHPLEAEILPGNVLEFKFTNINLPDYMSNEPGSHGYLIFEILPDSGLAEGTRIENKAHIYFDFNPPVITNAVYNTITNADPGTIDCSLAVGMENIPDASSILLYPNPAGQNISIQYKGKDTVFRIFNVLGKEVKSSGIVSGTTEIDLSELNSGIYFISIVDSNNIITTKKFVVQH